MFGDIEMAGVNPGVFDAKKAGKKCRVCSDFKNWSKGTKMKEAESTVGFDLGICVGSKVMFDYVRACNCMSGES